MFDSFQESSNYQMIDCIDIRKNLCYLFIFDFNGFCYEILFLFDSHWPYEDP